MSTILYKKNMHLSKSVNKGTAFTHSFNHIWSLSTYYVQKCAAGSGSTVMNKTEFQWTSHSVEENALETIITELIAQL